MIVLLASSLTLIREDPRSLIEFDSFKNEEIKENNGKKVFLPVVCKNNESARVEKRKHKWVSTKKNEIFMSSTPTADVQVFARFRPLNEREQRLSEETAAAAAASRGVYRFRTEGDPRTIEVLRPALSSSSSSSSAVEEKEFTFDGIFPETTSQEELYLQTARPLVAEVLKGFNCTMMAYGQTGAGKSYTMTGRMDDEAEPGQAGIIPRLLRDLFDEVAARASQTAFVIQCSYVEIYMERVRDLLNPERDNLKLREVVVPKASSTKKKSLATQSCVYIEGCTVCTVQHWGDMLKVMQRGDAHRALSATDMNARSSRSHAVFVVHVSQTDLVKQTRRASKLCLVDLAGSEQVQRSGVTGLALEQAKKINKSLSALAMVIQALVERQAGEHIPYRDSKLTRLLTDSLGGNAKTVLLLALSPSPDSLSETFSTLSFGARAKHMVNQATVNEELSLSTYKKMVSALTQEVDVWKRKYEEAVLQSGADGEQQNPPVDSAPAEGGADHLAALDSQLLSSSSAAPGHPETLEDWCMFQTGNVMVFGADKMFLFEPF